MRTPLVVITGIDPSAIDRAQLSLAWDLPQAVAVRHRIDPETQVLTRTVSDATGILEREEITLEHACVTCALREDIVPTLERLGRQGRWSSIVAALPAATEADQLARILATDQRLARHLRTAGIVAAFTTETLVHDLLADDLLRERGWHSNPYDGRGVGEVGCAQIEYADVVVVDRDEEGEAGDLLRALVRPGVPVVGGFDVLDAAAVVAGGHGFKRTQAWAAATATGSVPALGPGRAWRISLSSTRPFHPGRLLDQIGRLGTGRHRSRGCFWVPTRPVDALAWAGAGGQLSIGGQGPWGTRSPATRLRFTGVGTVPPDLVPAFEDLLLTPAEERASWRVLEDGLEPWLGDIRDAA